MQSDFYNESLKPSIVGENAVAGRKYTGNPTMHRNTQQQGHIFAQYAAPFKPLPISVTYNEQAANDEPFNWERAEQYVAIVGALIVNHNEHHPDPADQMA